MFKQAGCCFVTLLFNLDASMRQRLLSLILSAPISIYQSIALSRDQGQTKPKLKLKLELKPVTPHTPTNPHPISHYDHQKCWYQSTTKKGKCCYYITMRQSFWKIFSTITDHSTALSRDQAEPNQKRDIDHIAAKREMVQVIAQAQVQGFSWMIPKKRKCQCQIRADWREIMIQVIQMIQKYGW